MQRRDKKLEEKIEAIAQRIILANVDIDNFSIQGLLRQILKEIRIMSAETQAAIDDMKAEVERNTTVSASVVALVQSLSQQIEDAADDPEEIRSLAQQLRSSTDELASAVPANTPSEGGDTSGTGAGGTGSGGTGSGTSGEDTGGQTS